MSEVHRYKVVKMLSENGNRISYDPHGPEVVLASAFDGATRLFLDAAERCVASERREKELQQRLTAADERIDELTKPQGEQMACMPVDRSYDVRAKMIIAFNEAKKAGGDLDDALDAAYKSALRYSPNPLDAENPDRSPEDYAIEHAEYMAKSADDVLAKFQAYGLALLAVDEGGDDGEGELLENIDSTRSDLQEALVDLRGMAYEFRKHAAKLR